LRLSNDEFIVRNRRRAIINRVFDHSSSQVDEFLRVPEAERRMDLYRSHGRVVRVDNELFSEVGWIQVFEGQNMPIEGYHPLADAQSEEDIADYLEGIRGVIAKCVSVMPSHDEYIARMCAAKK
jgi:tryptophan halogenase